MMRTQRDIILFLVVAVSLILVGHAGAGLAEWNAEITASNPVNWYRFDEQLLSTDPNFPSDPNCYDHGSDGLNGIYTAVRLGQDGIFEPASAALFVKADEGEVTFPGATPIEGNWTAEYIVNKRQWHTAALHDDTFTSIRLEGYNTWDVGFTLYNKLYLPITGADYVFTVFEFESAQPPIGRWIHLVFRRNNLGTQLFINGKMVGTSRITIDFPRRIIGRGYGVGDDQLGATLDEVVVYDRALTDEEIESHAFVALPVLIPDDFESYADSTALADIWTGDAAVTLEKTEVYEGAQAMKAQFASAGSVAKVFDRKDDFSSYLGQEILIRLKGDAANDAGDVTLSLTDPNGAPFGGATYVNATQETDWTSLVMTISDTGEPWDEVAGVQIDVGAAATMYFDDLHIKVPTPRKVVEWKFNDRGSDIELDASGNGINGVIEGFVAGDWVDGRSGESGDYAIGFTGEQNQKITALDIDLPALGLSDIFKADSSWSMNIWLRFEQISNIGMIGGFGDCGYDELSGYEDRYFNRWNDTVEFNYGGTGFYDRLFSVNEWQMWTITYNKWTGLLTYYKDGVVVYYDEDGYIVIPRQPILLDTTENAVKLGNVGTIVWTPTYGQQNPLEGQIDDFTIWDGEIPWTDDDPETDDVLSLFGGSICYDASPYDVDGDCQVNIADLTEVALTWLEDGRAVGDF
jgi:hypothetical protein